MDEKEENSRVVLRDVLEKSLTRDKILIIRGNWKKILSKKKNEHLINFPSTKSSFDALLNRNFHSHLNKLNFHSIKERVREGVRESKGCEIENKTRKLKAKNSSHSHSSTLTPSSHWGVMQKHLSIFVNRRKIHKRAFGKYWSEFSCFSFSNSTNNSGEIF